LVYLFRIFK